MSQINCIKPCRFQVDGECTKSTADVISYTEERDNRCIYFESGCPSVTSNDRFWRGIYVDLF